MSIRIRDATATDEPFMWRMLGYAASDGDDERTSEELRADPMLGRYLDGWGRAGDVGVVAVDDDNHNDDSAIGAAWLRLFSADRPGYGFIDEVTPELTIACLAHARGVGVGRALIVALLDRAKHAGFARVCLSVAQRNPRAKALYLSCGFEPVGVPTDGGSTTLVVSTGA